MLNIRFIAPLLLIAAPLALAASANGPQLPDYIPSCTSPQMAGPIQPTGNTSNLNSMPTVVFNGTDYAVAWVDGSNAVRFRRFYADGTPAGPLQTPVAAIGASMDAQPGLVWTGTDYGLAYPDASYNIIFKKLDANGVQSTAPVQLNTAPWTSRLGSERISAAWSGAGFAVAWGFATATSQGVDIFVTGLDATGAVIPSLQAIDVSGLAGSESYPQILWSAPLNEYLLIFVSSTAPTTINYAVLTLAGSHSTGVLVTNAVGARSRPSVAKTENGYGLAWVDSRDGNNEIYFAVLNYNFGKVSADIRMTNDPATDDWPVPMWTGSEYGLVFADNRSGSYEIWYQRADGSGQPVGGNVRLTTSSGLSWPGAAFNRKGFLLAAGDYYFGNVSGPLHVLPVGCSYAYNPPSCPANFLAYNITGTTASVSWSPSSDPVADLAYYAVYRNNAMVGKTAVEYFNDSGLPLSSTNNYMIQPVNAWQLQNTTCTGSIYVKTNATLTLTMTKATTSDAGLNWTNAGFNNYNIFRGNRPQVMSQTGSTPNLSATDAGALTDTLSYFYSVDNPGP